MSSAKNIFPQLESAQFQTIEAAPHHSPYQSLVDNNRLKLKAIEANYFQYFQIQQRNQYKNILSVKQRQKQQQKLQKQRDRQLIQAKKSVYQQQIQRQTEKKLIEKAYLSSDYKSAIDQHQQKNKQERQLAKIIQKQVLNSPTWLKNAQSEREANLRKKMYYGKVLQQHIKLQQLRKHQQKQSERFEQQKIQRQADEMLQRQYYQMEIKHRQRSLFEQRQNQLLGVDTEQPNLQQSRSYAEKQKQMKMAEIQIYRQGLQAQFQREHQERNQKKRAFSQKKQDFNSRYNPITNPIPFIYKNPNVLRMLNQPY